MNELKKVVKFGIELGEAIEISLQDGKLGVEDFGALMTPLMAAPGAISSAKEAIAQAKAMTAEQRQELIAFVEVELDLHNDRIEAIIEKSIALVSDLVDLIAMFKKPEVVEAQPEVIAE